MLEQINKNKRLNIIKTIQTAIIGFVGLIGLSSFVSASPSVYWRNETGQMTDLAGSSSSTDVTNFELELARKTSGNSYMEYTEADSKITNVDYWTNSGKGTKLFSKTITYTGDDPTTVAITDESNSKVLTTTIAYSGSDVTSVTKVVS